MLISKNTNQKRIKITMLLAIAFLLLATIIPSQPSAATATCHICGKTYKDLTMLQKMDFEFSAVAETGQLFNASEKPNEITVGTLLKFDIQNGPSAFKELWKYARDAYNTMTPVGTVLATAYFLLGLMEKVVNDKMSAEQLAKDFIKLTAMLLIIINGFDLITWGMNVATYVYSVVLGDIGGGACKCSGVISTVKNRKGLEPLEHFSTIVAPYILLSAARVVVAVQVWGRVLNLVIRVALAPVGMADSIRGGTSSQGFKYLKKIIALALQGAIMVSINVVFGMIVSVGSFGTMSNIVSAAAMITLMTATGPIAHEIMGV